MDEKKLVTRPSSWLDDWYVIEYENGWDISDASVEGPRDHITAIAQAVIDGRAESFKRCAVDTTSEGGFVFWSPRNSMGRGDHIPKDVAVAWAKSTLDYFASNPRA